MERGGAARDARGRAAPLALSRPVAARRRGVGRHRTSRDRLGRGRPRGEPRRRRRLVPHRAVRHAPVPERGRRGGGRGSRRHVAAPRRPYARPPGRPARGVHLRGHLAHGTRAGRAQERFPTAPVVPGNRGGVAVRRSSGMGEPGGHSPQPGRGRRRCGYAGIGGQAAARTRVGLGRAPRLLVAHGDEHAALARRGQPAGALSLAPRALLRRSGSLSRQSGPGSPKSSPARRWA